MGVAHWAPSCQGWLGHLRVTGQWGCEDQALRRAGWGVRGLWHLQGSLEAGEVLGT